MDGPWEKYQTQGDGPWKKYAQPTDDRSSEIPKASPLKYAGEQPMDDPNFASGMKPMMRAVSSSFTNAGRDIPGEVQRIIGGMGPGATGALEAAAIAKGVQMIPKWSGALSEAPAAVRGFENYVRPAAQALTPDSLKGLAGLAGFGAMSGAGGVAGRDVATEMGAGPAGQQVGELAGMFIGPAPLGIPKAVEATGEAMGRGARGFMRSALKPTWEANKTGKGGKAVETMLEEGLNVTEGGEKTLRGTTWMQNRIRDLNEKVLQHAENSNAKVNWTKIHGYMDELTQKFAEQTNSTNSLATLQKIKHDFIDSMGRLTSDEFVPVSQAQRIKQNLYKSMGDLAYGKGRGDLQIEDNLAVLRAAARGWREEIDKVLPDAVPLNAEESKLINALGVSERRVMMDANKNPAGLGLLSHNKSAFAAWTADRSPLFKSLIARMLYRGEQLATERGRASTWFKNQPQGEVPLELAPLSPHPPTEGPRTGVPVPAERLDLRTAPGASVPVSTAGRQAVAPIDTPRNWHLLGDDPNRKLIRRTGEIPEIPRDPRVPNWMAEQMEFGPSIGQPRGVPPPTSVPDWFTSPGASIPRSSSAIPKTVSIPTPPKATIGEPDIPPSIRKSGDIPRGTSAGNLQIPGIGFHRPITDELGYIALTEKEQAALRDPATTLARKRMLEAKEAAAREKAEKAAKAKVVKKKGLDWPQLDPPPQ